MLGVQSCKHFGCQRSHPTILGFGHPSGALEDGAREKFLVPGTIFLLRGTQTVEVYRLRPYVESVYT